MPQGYIKNFNLDENSLNIERCKKASNVVDGETFSHELKSAIFDLTTLYQDTLDGQSRTHEDEADKQITFLKNPKFPSGAYNVIAHTDKNIKYENDGEDYAIVHGRIILDFYAASNSKSFYKMTLDFGQIRHTNYRYNSLIRNTENAILSANTLEDIYVAEMYRESGHKGIIASMFPESFNHGLPFRGNFDPEYRVSYGFASRTFNIVRALFPEGPYDDINYGVKEFDENALKSQMDIIYPSQKNPPTQPTAP